MASTSNDNVLGLMRVMCGTGVTLLSFGTREYYLHRSMYSTPLEVCMYTRVTLLSFGTRVVWRFSEHYAQKYFSIDGGDSASRRPSCPYGGSCYRQNPQHKGDEAHPGDDDYMDPTRSCHLVNSILITFDNQDSF